jgi:hypothetical protein
MADCARKRMLRLLGRLDRVLVGGAIHFDFDDLPPDGPELTCTYGADVSLGAVVFVGVNGASVNAWKRGYPETYALNYQGKTQYDPNRNVTSLGSCMKSGGGSFLLGINDISSVCVQTSIIRAGLLLISNESVGLHIATNQHGSILLKLVAIQSIAGVSHMVCLKHLTEFLTQDTGRLTPNRISMCTNCDVKIWIDPASCWSFNLLLNAMLQYLRDNSRDLVSPVFKGHCEQGAMADCKARHTTLLLLLGRLDRVLVAGQHRLLAAVNESPPAGPNHVQQGDASESLGAVAFVGVVDAVRDRWRTPFPRECVLPYRGMGLIQPGYAMTQCSASITTCSGLERLKARDMSAVSIVSVRINGEGQLHTCWT